MLQRTAGNGVITKYGYDDNGQVVSIHNSSPNGSKSSLQYTYDAVGNRLSQVEDDGATTSYQYDGLDRLIDVTYPKEKIEQIQKIFHTGTPPIKAQSGNIQPNFLGSLTLAKAPESNGQGKGNSAGGNGNGNQGNNGHGDGRGNSEDHRNDDKGHNGNGKDKEKHKDKKKDKNKDKVKNEIDQENEITEAEFTEEELLELGFVEEDLDYYREIDPEYHLLPSAHVSYEYDGVGNRTRMTDDYGTTAYSYDAAGQLLTAGSTRYSYDPNGNMVSKETEKGTFRYEYGADDRLAKVTLPNQSYVTYSYDAFGRKALRNEWYYDVHLPQNKGNNGAAVGKGSERGKSDEHRSSNGNGSSNGNNGSKANGIGKGLTTAPGQQKKANNGNSNSKANGIGKGLTTAPGQQKKAGGSAIGGSTSGRPSKPVIPLREETTSYLYSGSNLLKEYTQAGSPLRAYYQGAGEIISEKMFGFHGRKDQGREGNLHTRGGLLYYGYDALGNVTDLVDHLGNDVMKYRYDAFGGLYTGVVAPFNTHGYTGQTYDPTSGLLDYNARWYSAKAGRFTSKDTFQGYMGQAQTHNLYSYVANNPLKYTDPTGHYLPGDENLPQDVQDAIESYGRHWESSDSETRDWLHDQADRIRQDYWNSQNEGGGSSGGGGYHAITLEEIIARRDGQFSNLAGVSGNPRFASASNTEFFANLKFGNSPLFAMANTNTSISQQNEIIRDAGRQWVNANNRYLEAVARGEWNVAQRYDNLKYLAHETAEQARAKGGTVGVPTVFIPGFLSSVSHKSWDSSNTFNKMLDDMERDHIGKWVGTYTVRDSSHSYNRRSDIFSQSLIEVQFTTLNSITESWKDLSKQMDPVMEEIRDNYGTKYVNIVAHSQGGLVAMDYMERHLDDTKVVNFVTLGTPFKGSKTAGGATDLALGYANVELGISENRLSFNSAGEKKIYEEKRPLAEKALEHTRILSIYGRKDSFVSEDSATALINVHSIYSEGFDIGHTELTKNPGVIKKVNDFIFGGVN